MESKTLVQHSLTGQHYGYSAADLSDLGSTQYTLVTLIVDESSSVSSFKQEMEECIKKAINACKFSPRSDYLLIRLVAFNRHMREIHGFKQLVDCDISDYNNCLHPNGTTLLFETTVNAIEATNDYSISLADQDFEANAIIICITDGIDNESHPITASSVAESLKKITKEESLESILTILVGVGIGSYSNVSDYLDDFKDKAGITQYIEIKDADEKSLAKLADFISKSISSQSQSLGTGSVSQPLLF